MSINKLLQQGKLENTQNWSPTGVQFWFLKERESHRNYLRGQQSIDGFGTDEILDPHAAKRGGFRGHVVSHEFGHRVFLFSDLGSSIPSTTTAALLLRAPRSHCQHGKWWNWMERLFWLFFFLSLGKQDSQMQQCFYMSFEMFKCSEAANCLIMGSIWVRFSDFANF